MLWVVTHSLLVLLLEHAADIGPRFARQLLGLLAGSLRLFFYLVFFGFGLRKVLGLASARLNCLPGRLGLLFDLVLLGLGFCEVGGFSRTCFDSGAGFYGAFFDSLPSRCSPLPDLVLLGLSLNGSCARIPLCFGLQE